jgi:DNA-dependent metalloprotease WSS1
VRLRPHHAPNSLLPYEDVLSTMLHEITHNVQGPHDAQFYKVLDEVTQECEDLVARGVCGTGTGFDGPSMGRLGAHAPIPKHNPPEHAMKAAQLKCVPAFASCRKECAMALAQQLGVQAERRTYQVHMHCVEDT